MKKILFLVFVFMIIPQMLFGAISPRSIGGESRIKLINYVPNSVFRYTGHYYYQGIIEFSLTEEIQTITMGTPTPWQMTYSKNRIFLKPVEEDATTNMTVITNKRMYFFEMHAKNADGVGDDDLAFIVKFVYPSENVYSTIQNVAASTGPNLANPSLYNFNYKISGKSEEIEPVQVFDDKVFTYFKFKKYYSAIPAIFHVNPDGSEGLVNYRVEKGYVIVERVAKRFTLRYGKDVICVFNENLLKKH